jgi:hypothetical protein
MKKDNVISLMVESGYRKLFLSGDNNLLDSIWQDGENMKSLKSIIAAKKNFQYAQFLAAEVLRYYSVDLDSKFYDNAAKAYTYVLKETSADRGNSVRLNGNLWGLLYEENDSGQLGSQFVKFGEASIFHLKKLLNDNAGRILYEGSEEAVIGSGYQYRIKDFAAFYISKIRNIPVNFYQDFEDRDKEIERLKKLLESDKK